jgi:glycosyltransferase involved in cell wall biosynthesis
MKRRVFICSTCFFPRGSASANYIQYFALALIEKECEVIVISHGDYNLCDYDTAQNKHFYKSIIFEKVDAKRGKLGKLLDLNWHIGITMQRILQNYSINSNDTIVTYSTDSSILNPLLIFAKKRRIKIAACIVEWFAKEDFNSKLLNIKYLKYNYVYRNTFSKFDIVFPISSYLENYLKSRGCNTFCLPIMADPYEYEISSKPNNQKNKYLFIANGRMKDAQDILIKSFNLLPKEVLEKIEIHFRGVSKEYIINVLGQFNYSNIRKSLFFHGWLGYNELVELYKSADFLLLPREESQMTLANFPSKVPEVMSYGVIPIISKVGDCTDYLNNGEDSIFINACTADECANAIKKAEELSSSCKSQMSYSAYSTVLNKFYYRVWNDQIYNKLFNE